MEITITTPAVQLMPSQGAGFAMSGCGQLSLGVIAGVQGTGLRPTSCIDLLDVIGAGEAARTRTTAVKGHVSATAYVPGLPAWSPPI